MLNVNLAGEMFHPSPKRILDQPIDMQDTTDHICLLFVCAKGACILLNQLT